jgi:hypothetical protein
MKRREWRREESQFFNQQRAKGKEHRVKDFTLCPKLYAPCHINSETGFDTLLSLLCLSLPAHQIGSGERSISHPLFPSPWTGEGEGGGEANTGNEFYILL